jgi:hypothetical protein
MNGIECQWCKEQNASNSTHCHSCGAPLDVKNRVGDPGFSAPSFGATSFGATSFSAPSMPPAPEWNYLSTPSGPYPGPYPGAPRPWRVFYRAWQWLWILTFIGFVAFVGFHMVKPFSSSFSSTGPNNSSTGPKKQYLTADGLNGLLGEIRNHFGDTMGYKLIVYPDYAIVDRVDPENNRYAKSYMDSSGKWSDWGPSSKPDSDEPLIDLTKLDVAAVTAALPGAPQKLGITNVKSTYLIFDAGGAKLYVSDGVESGSMEFNPDGSVAAVHPPS